MAATEFGKVVRQLRGVLARQDTARLPDADLWQRYVGQQDEAAFETLVRRHGPMVLGVCRRVLRNEQDAEDAFQATFLVLVRRAASLRSPSTIANWLHGVAYRTALEARGAAARRRAREAAVPPRTVMPEDPWAELWPVLDQELGRLAEKYRAVIVLCDLEGKTRKEVARQLGCVEGTVASRLARARGVLARRLARRGFTGASVASALVGGAASAAVPVRLVAATVAAAESSTATGAAAHALLSAEVIALAEGVLRSMFLSKLKTATAVLLVLGMAALGAAGLIPSGWGTEPPAVQPGRANPDGRREQLAELKRQLDELQKKLAGLEQEAQPARAEPKTGAPSFPVERFKYRVPFELGYRETKDGGRIEIREVWGTRPRIEIGGQYLVRGTYALPPRQQRGKVYFYATAGGPWGETAELDLQTTVVNQPTGEFTLLHGMAGQGSFHIVLTEPDDYSRMFANVYFGTGDNVYRR
jgi:RNA polymerase sigma factor (sigma-70 family)